MKTDSQKKMAVKPATGSKSNTLCVKEIEGKSKERALAELGLCSLLTNASTSRAFSMTGFGELDIAETITVMREKTERVQAGDLSDIEATLAAQAVALDIMFTELARRAALNMGTHLVATETYLRLALKAQGQSRVTMQTLAEVKYPKTATFVRQQNNAYQQQVNNGGGSGLPATDTRAREKVDSTNELLSGGGA